MHFCEGDAFCVQFDCEGLLLAVTGYACLSEWVVVWINLFILMAYAFHSLESWRKKKTLFSFDSPLRLRMVFIPKLLTDETL